MSLEKYQKNEVVSGISIEAAAPEDVSEIAELNKRVFSETYPDFPEAHTDEEDLEHFTSVLENESVRVARSGGKIIGYIAFSPGQLNKLYIDPEFQGHGLGEKLVDLAKAENDHLLLWTFQVNDKAKRFYERLGFVAVQETDGATNDEGQPDVQYEWKRSAD